MQNLSKLLTVFFIISLLQMIVSIMLSKYYVTGLGGIPGEKIFISAQAKEKAIIIQTIHLMLVMIILIYVIVVIGIPMIIPIIKSTF